MGSKLADLPVHDGATGPFVVSGYGGYKQVQAPGGKLFAFDAEGNYVLTCTGNGGIIYKVWVYFWLYTVTYYIEFSFISLPLS